VEYCHGQKTKLRFTTTTSVRRDKKCTKQTKHDPSQKQRILPYSNGTPTTAQTATTVPKRTMTMALLVTSAATIISLAVWGSWMGSRAMTTQTTKIDDDAHPPQIVIAV